MPLLLCLFFGSSPAAALPVYNVTTLPRAAWTAPGQSVSSSCGIAVHPTTGNVFLTTQPSPSLIVEVGSPSLGSGATLASTTGSTTSDGCTAGSQSIATFGKMVNGAAATAQFAFGLASPGYAAGPGLAFRGSNLIVADVQTHTIRSVNTASNNAVTTLAGLCSDNQIKYNNGPFGGGFSFPPSNQDGTASTAQSSFCSTIVSSTCDCSAASSGVDCPLPTWPTFYGPGGVAVDSSGNLYISEGNVQGGPGSPNKDVRKMTAAGVVTTIVTSAMVISAGGTSAFNPTGVAVDSNGVLYIASYNEHVIYKFASGVLTTFAGTGSPYSTASAASADGTGTSAVLCFPRSLAVDLSTNNLYVVDSGGVGGTAGTINGGMVRMITPAGVVTTGMNDIGMLLACVHELRLPIFDSHGPEWHNRQSTCLSGRSRERCLVSRAMRNRRRPVIERNCDVHHRS